MSLLDFSLLVLIGAFGGGLFGAAIGGLNAFIFTGFTVLAGVAIAASGGDYDFLGNVAFGPVFGPHIAFSGGVAAAAFANRQGMIEDGKDIASGMVGLANPAVLVVGGVFGIIGYVGQVLLDQVPLALGVGGDFGYTDTIALMVALSNIIARLVFGKAGIIGKLSEEAAARGRFVADGANVWVPFQKDWGMAAVIGIGAGAIGAFIVGAGFAQGDLDAAGAVLVTGFGISAASLIFLTFGKDCPVTHHMTLPAAVAAFQMLNAGFAIEAAMIVGVLFGVIGALLGEFFARLFLIHGDTFVDPPANAIWSATTLALILGFIVG